MALPKILHVASGALWGGAEAAVYELCGGLRDRGHPVMAVIMNPGELAQRLHAAGIRTETLDERRESSPKLAARLRRCIAEFRPDVVHGHRTKENVLAALVSFSLGPAHPRLVKTLHGAPEHRRGALWSRRGLAQLVDSATDSVYAARVAVSSDLARRMASDGARELVTIHNGLAPPPPRPHIPAADRDQVVGFGGRLVPVKRVDLLLRVAAEVKQLRGTRVGFEIAGEGPLKTELEALSSKLGLGDVVEFTGFSADIWSRLARWDATMLTSDHEGLPMVCLESLAAGVPMLARQVGGLGEVILGPEQGELVDSADPKLIAVRLISLLESEARRTERASRLPETFTREAMCRSYASLYEQVIS